jgi:predicted RNase H-like HicB family nuclease
MKKYLVIYEKTRTGYSAYVPDLPGCISTGRTRREIEKNIQKAIEFHIEGMLLDGEKVPEPSDNFAFIKIRPAVKGNHKSNISRKKKITA